MLHTNKQIIEWRRMVTEQLLTFVEISGQLRQQIHKLEMLIADEKQQLDMTVLEQSRYVSSYFHFTNTYRVCQSLQIRNVHLTEFRLLYIIQYLLQVY